MGKRSNKERNPRDFYPTPYEGIIPLLPHIAHIKKFVEPCAGKGDLISHLNRHGIACHKAIDISPNKNSRTLNIRKGDALKYKPDSLIEALPIITNPPWRRDILHPMIEHLSQFAPTWLLLDADWKYTIQKDLALRDGVMNVPELMDKCTDVVAVGRLKWIAGSKYTGKDNCAWYRFVRQGGQKTIFHARSV